MLLRQPPQAPKINNHLPVVLLRQPPKPLKIIAHLPVMLLRQLPGVAQPDLISCLPLHQLHQHHLRLPLFTLAQRRMRQQRYPVQLQRHHQPSLQRDPLQEVISHRFAPLLDPKQVWLHQRMC